MYPARLRLVSHSILWWHLPLGGRFSFFSVDSTGNSLASLGAGQEVESCKDGMSVDFFDFFDFLAAASVQMIRKKKIGPK